MTSAELEEKLFNMPKIFDQEYDLKHYWQAKTIYERARTIAVFMELPDSKMIKLFGGKAYGTEDEGLFQLWKVQRAVKECIMAKK